MATAGRKPIHEAQDNRQILWDELKVEAEKGNARMTLSVLASRTGVDRKTASDYLVGLSAAGYVERQEDETLGCATFRLVQDGGFHAPRLRKDGTPVTQGVGVANMWRSMRILKVFSVPEIAQTSSTPGVVVTDATAQSYIGMLFATGYLRVVEKANIGLGRKATYRLVRNSGPKPPMIQRVKQVYDPNTKLVHPKADRP
jgi:predicted transcriptional regulator